jgi:hypothetical protein
MSGTTAERRWTRRIALVLTLALAAGCNGGGGKEESETCLNMGSAVYSGTEDVNVTSGVCPSYSDLTVTFTITQAAGSCSFTLVNSRASGSFPGTVSDDQVSWTGSYPQSTGTVTIDSVSATVSGDLATLSGAFTWSYAGATTCAGTTSFSLTRQ